MLIFLSSVLLGALSGFQDPKQEIQKAMDALAAPIVPLSTCGIGAGMDEATGTLLRHGAAALPSIEAAIQEFEDNPRMSRFTDSAYELYGIYAMISGARAAPRLIYSPLRDRMNLSSQIATALGLTSYVQGNLSGAPVRRCDGKVLQQDALNQLIIGWQQADWSLASAVLSREAKLVLEKTMGSRSWQSLHAATWRRTLPAHYGIGYKLEALESAGLAEETMRSKVLFVDGEGAKCGEVILTFEREAKGAELGRFLLGGENSFTLLRLVTKCTSATPVRR